MTSPLTMLSVASLLSFLISIRVAGSSSCKSDEAACASSGDHDEDAFLQFGSVRSHVQSIQFSVAKPVLPYPFGAYNFSMVDLSSDPIPGPPEPPPSSESWWVKYPCMTKAMTDNQTPTYKGQASGCDSVTVENIPCWKDLGGKMDKVLQTCCVEGTDSAEKEKDLCDQKKLERGIVEQNIKGLELKLANEECMTMVQPGMPALTPLYQTYSETCDDADFDKLVKYHEKLYSQGDQACQDMGHAELKQLTESDAIMKCCFMDAGVSMQGPPPEGGKEAALEAIKNAYPKCCSSDSPAYSMCGGLKKCMTNPDAC